MRCQRTPGVLPVGPVGRNEDSRFPLPSRARPGDDRTGQFPFVLQVPGGALEETGVRLCHQVVLLAPVEHVDFDGQLPPEEVQKGADEFRPHTRRGRTQRLGHFDEALALAFAHGETGFPQSRLLEQAILARESLVLEPQQSAVL